MILSRGSRAFGARKFNMSAVLLGSTALAMLANPAFAQNVTEASPADPAASSDEIVVTGIRGSLQGALNEKRRAASLIEVIKAEDIGKLPDQNLAEVLENVPGVQITRDAGVGTGVQIRGTNANRTEINGVGTLGSGSGRSGIGFEDINAAIIAAVEVTKAPTAITTEGSVGGTINLRTIRPLDLRKPLLAARVQGEYSEFSRSVQPRLSASFGDKWNVGDGEIGIVLSGSYTKQDALSFRPRVDRDTLIVRGSGVTATGAAGPSNDYLGIQFLNQVLEDFQYKTYNLAGSLEYAPTTNLKFYLDGFYNKQDRNQSTTRVQASGVSNLRLRNVPATFETINFGTLGGVDLGSIQAAETGSILPNAAIPGANNLRFSSDTGARLTTSNLFRAGTEWESGRFKARIEGSRALSSTRNPNLSTTLYFINPNVARSGTLNYSSVPFAYDLSGGSLAFGIDNSSSTAPSTSQLLDPNNVVLNGVTVGNNSTRNVEYAGRMDLSLDLSGLTGFLKSFDWGYRYNKTTTQFTEISSNINLTTFATSPNGSTFSQLLVPGPSNFNRADGRSLFIGDFLIIDPRVSASDQAGTLSTLQAAILARGGSVLANPSFQPGSYYQISENTHAFYGQLNFESGIFSGNAGLRYVDTTLNSNSNIVNASNVITGQQSSVAKYQFLLPRVNLAANLTDKLVARASYGKDINRPNFLNLARATRFTTGPNTPVTIGNPSLVPEAVTAYDASLSWYFARSSVVSVAFFHKRRTNLFVTRETAPPLDANGFRSISPSCPGGGIYNPLADHNVFFPTPGTGLCVPGTTTINDPSATTQTGIEVAFQADLSSFEDKIGFASGFGVSANYTYQKFGGGKETQSSRQDSRATPIFNSSTGTTNTQYTAVQGLLDFSPHAYNVTLFYEKYGLSARARYTWRSAFRTFDTAGGATAGSTLGFPVVTAARGQLNGSINYDLTENINIGIEGVNLTKSKISQYCVNDGALLCFQGLPDRRLTFGASIKF